MVTVPLPTFVDYMLARGSAKVTVVRAAKRQLSSEPYNQVDYYFHLRRPLVRALLAGGDPAPLVECVQTLDDPKKLRNYEEIVAGLSRVFRSHSFEAEKISKHTWSHAQLEVPVTPAARVKIDGGGWEVAFVYLKDEPLDARAVAPILELLYLTHGDLGSPVIIDARRSKLLRPSRSASIRRGMQGLLEGEAESILRLWLSDLEAA